MVPAARWSPSGLQATALMLALVSSFTMATPVLASQTMTEVSEEPEARRLPSGDQETATTEVSWPSRSCSSFPVAGSKIRTVESPRPTASRCPSYR